MSIALILIVLALICFVLATFNVGAPVNLTALGLAFLTAVLLVGGGTGLK